MLFKQLNMTSLWKRNGHAHPRREGLGDHWIKAPSAARVHHMIPDILEHPATWLGG